MKKSIICFLLIHEIPPVEGSISGMSLGAPASREARTGPIGGSGAQEGCGPAAPKRTEPLSPGDDFRG